MIAGTVPEVVAHNADAKGAIRLTVRGQSRTFETADLNTWMAMGDRLLKTLRWIDGVLGDASSRDTLQYAAIKGALDVLDPVVFLGLGVGLGLAGRISDGAGRISDGAGRISDGTAQHQMDR